MKHKMRLIDFENRTTLEHLEVKVVNLLKYPSFEELYKHCDKESMGYEKKEIANPKDMEQYYSKEEQEKYGVLGIVFELQNIEKDIYETRSGLEKASLF